MCFEEGRAAAWFAARQAATKSESPAVARADDQRKPVEDNPLALPDISPMHGLVAEKAPTESQPTPDVTFNTRAAMAEIDGMFMEALPCDAEAVEPTVTFATRAAMGAIDDMFQEALPCEAAGTPRLCQVRHAVDGHVPFTVLMNSDCMASAGRCVGLGSGSCSHSTTAPTAGRATMSVMMLGW